MLQLMPPNSTPLLPPLLPHSRATAISPCATAFAARRSSLPLQASPPFVKDAMKRAMDENANQYCRSAGHIPLVQAIAKR